MRAAVVAVALLLPGPSAHASEQLLRCSAEYKARADWLGAMDKASDTKAMMETRSELLLGLAERDAAPVDQDIVFPRMDAFTLEAERDLLALDALTRLVELAGPEAVLTTCMEDPLCQTCLTLMPS